MVWPKLLSLEKGEENSKPHIFSIRLPLYENCQLPSCYRGDTLQKALHLLKQEQWVGPLPPPSPRSKEHLREESGISNDGRNVRVQGSAFGPPLANTME